MNTEVDISMFNTDNLKLVLFYSLLNKSIVEPTCFITKDADITQHKLILESIKKGYIDRFNGRVFKTDISGLTFDPRLYNRDNGAGAAERIVKKIQTDLQI
jgi:hypothetical protein